MLNQDFPSSFFLIFHSVSAWSPDFWHSGSQIWFLTRVRNSYLPVWFVDVLFVRLSAGEHRQHLNQMKYSHGLFYFRVRRANGSITILWKITRNYRRLKLVGLQSVYCENLPLKFIFTVLKRAVKLNKNNSSEVVISLVSTYIENCQVVPRAKISRILGFLQPLFWVIFFDF